MTRVFIGIPGFAGIQPECQENIGRMLFRLGRDTDYEILFRIVVKSEQFRARNALVNEARQAEADYLLMLDDDMIIPPDLLQRMMVHDKDVTGALYYQRGGAYHPVVMQINNRDDGTFSCSFLSATDPMIMQPGLYPVDVIGGGCMLFKMHVFDKVLEPYFWWEANNGTDIAICRRMLGQGYQPYIDTSIELGHLGNKAIVNSRTIPLDGRIMQEANQSLQDDLKEYLGMTDAELLFAMDKANNREFHANIWKEKDRADEEDVFDFYRDERAEPLTNLALYNLNKSDPIKSWALMPENALVKSHGTYVDYGSGLGHLSIPLAEKGPTVWAMDIADSQTLEFVKWRAAKRASFCYHHPLKGEVPQGTFESSFDGVFMISVIEHLAQPHAVIEWLGGHVRKGGFFACDWFVTGHSENEPQHLDRHDPRHFPEWMQKHGWEMSSEHPWLFLRK